MDKICCPGPFRMTRLTWLLGDMEFLFSCSTVEHSKRNSISLHVHSLCLLVKVIPSKVCQDACFSVGVLAKIIAWSQCISEHLLRSMSLWFCLFPVSKLLFSFLGRKVRVLCSSKGLPHQDISLWDFYLEVNKDSKQVSLLCSFVFLKIFCQLQSSS